MLLAFFGAVPAPGVSAAGLYFPLVPKWSLTLEVPPAFAPAYDGDRAFVALQNNKLIAVALNTGTSGWSVECPTSVGPAAGDSLVFTGSDSLLQAFDQHDGAHRWTTSLEGSITSLYWNAGWLLATSVKHALFALRATDGKVIWQHDLEAAIDRKSVV